MIETVTIIGAGNGGKAAAADLALQGKRVRLFEFPEYRANVDAIIDAGHIAATGAVQGEAKLDLVTCDLPEAMLAADMAMVCTQAQAHGRAARDLAALVQPDTLVFLNPGSCAGTLEFASVFRHARLSEPPILVETSTLTYGCRGQGARVDVHLKVQRVMYGTLPATAISTVGPDLEAMYPGLVRGSSVLEAGLNNANPVIHPAITLLNVARIEKEGAKMLFYGHGVSRTVARVIAQLDHERMALLRALGCPAQSDPATSVAQGYATSSDYFECYSQGQVFKQIASPDTLDNRFLHEDIGIGLVMFCSLGRLLRVPTPACEAVVRMGSLVAGRDYFAQGARTLEALGLDGLNIEELKGFLQTGQMPRSA